MNLGEKMFECSSLKCLNQKEDLDKKFLECDLSIFSEREIVEALINRGVFSDNEKELIIVWATILKSKKLFEMAEGSNLTDVEFVANLERVCRLERFIELVSSIDWRYATIDANDEYVAGIKGFYEEIAIVMAKNKSLTIEFLEKVNLKGVDWNYKDVEGKDILKAVCGGSPNMDLLTYLLDKEVNINMQNVTGETAFKYLCGNESVTLDMIKLFFDKGVDIDLQNNLGQTAFMWLCSNKSITLDMVKLFLEKGVDIKSEDGNGETAFMWLCNNESVTLDMIKLFFDKDVDFDNNSVKRTLAFVLLCDNKSITLDMIKLFLEKGVDVGLQAWEENTAFMYLCSNGSVTLDMIKLFLEKGADLNIKNIDGLSPLDCYTRSGGQNEEILKLLGQS